MDQRAAIDVWPSLDQAAGSTDTGRRDATGRDSGSKDSPSGLDGASPADASAGGDAASFLDGGQRTDADARARVDGTSRPDTRRPPDLFVRLDTRPPTAPIRFRLRGQVSGFSLTGQIQGNCVTFETQESTAEVGTLRYSFTGTLEKDGQERKISGSFNGSGPAGCSAAGDFTVTIH